MKEILIYPLEILLLLQNAGETISIIKFLMSFKIYGKIIVSQEAQKEFLFSIPGLMLLPFLEYSLQIIVTQEALSSQEKFWSISRFYIVESATSMLFIMSMNIMMILHGILMIATHLVLMILIKSLLMHLLPHPSILLSLMIQKMNCPLKHLLQKTHITSTIKNYLVRIKKTFLIQWKIDSPIFLACTTAKMLQCLPLVKSQLLYCFPIQMMLLLIKWIPHDYVTWLLSA